MLKHIFEVKALQDWEENMFVYAKKWSYHDKKDVYFLALSVDD